jgi:hypothetical protein
MFFVLLNDDANMGFLRWNWDVGRGEFKIYYLKGEKKRGKKEKPGAVAWHGSATCLSTSSIWTIERC